MCVRNGDEFGDNHDDDDASSPCAQLRGAASFVALRRPAAASTYTHRWTHGPGLGVAKGSRYRGRFESCSTKHSQGGGMCLCPWH